MKTWLVRICVFLLLGALVNVVVAWGLSCLETEPLGAAGSFTLTSPSEPPRLKVEVESSVGRTFVRGFATRRINVQIPPLPTWSRMSDFRDLKIANGNRVDECGSGWPLFALYSCRAKLTVSTSAYRPLWPGFAINTLFYAAVLRMLFAAPFALRRRMRITRGLCPKCSYDLRGSIDAAVCPECGASDPPPLRAGVRGQVEHTA